MPSEFKYDIFLSHSSSDRAVVEDIANRLRDDGLAVYFADLELKQEPVNEFGLHEEVAASRLVVLCFSSNYSIREWKQVGIESFIFRYQRARSRLIPLRLDSTRLPDLLAPFETIDWQSENRNEEYHKLIRACRRGQPRDRLNDSIRYTNAKVIVVGESGVGKSALVIRLTNDRWGPSESTHGLQLAQWKLPNSSTELVKREIWLWDFGGQADQRLIQDLYTGDAALAVLVFDTQRDDLIETLTHWDRNLTRTARKAFAKLLVGSRADVGGLRVSRTQIETFAREHGFIGYLETSAKTGLGCRELQEAIVSSIRWETIPWSTSSLLFSVLKNEVLSLKETGRSLIRFDDLSETLRTRLASGDDERASTFDDAELRGVIGLLAGIGVVWELAFGSLVLLQPEWINFYAGTIIQTLREDSLERGCIPEDRVLSGSLKYPQNAVRLQQEDERLVLYAIHNILIERGLCLRQQTDRIALLVFPGYYRRERPELVDHPDLLISYCFAGAVDEIFATLVVRLHYTQTFQQAQLWRDAADLKTSTGRRLGIKLTRRGEDAGDLGVYCDQDIAVEEKLVFSRYVHEHLLQKAHDVVRLRHYVCPQCGTPVGNPNVAAMRLSAGKPDVICVFCESRIPLRDPIEQMFDSPEIRERVLALQRNAATMLDQESTDRVLVGEVISTVALAGQISRELGSSDHGIDMEVEFKDDAGQATGKKVYLQLKSGDSHLRRRQRDGVEVFEVTSPRHLNYWIAQPFPVMLVIRTNDGRVRWMDLRDWLIRVTENGRRPIQHIPFEGTPLDVMSVRRWREPMIQQSRESVTTRVELEPDSALRLRALETLVQSWPDDETRELLIKRAQSDSDAGIRSFAVKKLAAAWPNERTRDVLLGVGETDTVEEVLAVVSEVLATFWWKDLKVRGWLRVIPLDLLSESVRGRIASAIKMAGLRVAESWEAKLSGQSVEGPEAELHPGYPAFRIARFRLRNIGPFIDTREIVLNRDLNIMLGDNAAGKTTILRCLGLAALGLAGANEVEPRAEGYLRKGTGCGRIEVLFELIPDPDSGPSEKGCFAVGLQINASSSRFVGVPSSEMSMPRPSQQFELLPNSAEFLSALRTDRSLQFGFISGYGPVRTFSESLSFAKSEATGRENEWVNSLFDTGVWLAHPDLLSKLIRGDTSKFDDAPAGGLSTKLIDTLRTSLRRLCPELTALAAEPDADVRLNGTTLRFGELSEGYRSLLALMGHLLRCALRFLSWNSDPTGIAGVVLIDEIDLHLHPEWQARVVRDFRRAFSNVQLIASTHSPLVIGELNRDEVTILRCGEDGTVTLHTPEFSPQGLGIGGILTSIFDLGATVDQVTLDKVSERLLLFSRRESWSDEDRKRHEGLSYELAQLGFTREFSDPYFERFATAMARRHKATIGKLTIVEKRELDSFADKLLADITGELKQ